MTTTIGVVESTVDASRAQRAATDLAATGDLAAAAKRLTEARKAAAREVAEAERAMLKALTVVDQYNDLVRATVEDVRGRGLRLSDGLGAHDVGADHEKVRLAGEWWTVLPLQQVHLRSHEAVGAAAYFAQPPLARQSIAPAFLALLPTLPARTRPPMIRHTRTDERPPLDPEAFYDRNPERARRARQVTYVEMSRY